MCTGLYEWATFSTGSSAVVSNGAIASCLQMSSYKTWCCQHNKDLCKCNIFYFHRHWSSLRLHSWNIRQNEIYKHDERKDFMSLGSSKKCQGYICLPIHPLVLGHGLFGAVKPLICSQGTLNTQAQEMQFVSHCTVAFRIDFSRDGEHGLTFCKTRGATGDVRHSGQFVIMTAQ